MTTPEDRITWLIDRLVDEVGPVRRLWPPAMRLASWLGVLLVVAACLATIGFRRDVLARLASPGYVVELVCLGAATVASAWMALRGAVPGLAPGRWPLVLAAAIVGSVALGLTQMRIAPPASFSAFLDAGIPCGRLSILLALAPLVALLGSIARALPLRPVPTCIAGGLAASLAAYAMTRLRCPRDEMMHWAVWHGGPIVLTTILAAAIGLAVVRIHRVEQPSR